MDIKTAMYIQRSRVLEEWTKAMEEAYIYKQLMKEEQVHVGR